MTMHSVDKWFSIPLSYNKIIRRQSSVQRSAEMSHMHESELQQNELAKIKMHELSVLWLFVLSLHQKMTSESLTFSPEEMNQTEHMPHREKALITCFVQLSGPCGSAGCPLR